MTTPAGSNWPPPAKPEIVEEDQIAEGRIDLTIHDLATARLVAVEGKTVESSVQPGQLDAYVTGLFQKYGGDIQLVFLTPFNRRQAGTSADSLDSVRTFDDFRTRHPFAVHLSWLDLADIPWDGGDLWEQHREYVRAQMCAPQLLIRHDRATGNPGLVDAYIAAVESDPIAHPIQRCAVVGSALGKFSSVGELYAYTVCVFTRAGEPLAHDAPVTSAYWLLFDNVYSRRRPQDKYPANATDVPGFRPKGGPTDERIAATLWDCAVEKCGAPDAVR